MTWTYWAHWNETENLPPLTGEDYGDWRNTERVLAVTGGRIVIAYAQVWTEEASDLYGSRRVRWKLDGRDGYDMPDGDPMCWAHLPTCPRPTT